LCRSNGLEVIWSKFVRAGRWDETTEGDGERSKEILVNCGKA